MLMRVHHSARSITDLSMKLLMNKELKRTRNRLGRITQASIHACGGTLDGMLSPRMGDRRWQDDLARPGLARAVFRDYVHESNIFTDLYTVPELELPAAKLEDFMSQLWEYAAHYKYLSGQDGEIGHTDADANHHAYLVTHLAYMPTGYGRHRFFYRTDPGCTTTFAKTTTWQ